VQKGSPYRGKASPRSYHFEGDGGELFFVGERERRGRGGEKRRSIFAASRRKFAGGPPPLFPSTLTKKKGVQHRSLLEGEREGEEDG